MTLSTNKYHLIQAKAPQKARAHLELEAAELQSESMKELAELVVTAEICSGHPEVSCLISAYRCEPIINRTNMCSC